ncbi:hypothetical protein [Bartonella tamiae]|nr:hypothetical protein [Bartonella tamiae]EJF92677.1 hypothetical protein MEG_01847 [Bartonella tamiae Th307]
MMNNSYHLNQAINDLNSLTRVRKTGWLREKCNDTIGYCLSTFDTPEQAKEYLCFLIDEQTK